MLVGVFQNLLPRLPESVNESTLRGVLDVLVGVVSVDHAPLLAGCDRESEGLRLVFCAQELACEVLANICYTEGEVLSLLMSVRVPLFSLS